MQRTPRSPRTASNLPSKSTPRLPPYGKRSAFAEIPPPSEMLFRAGIAYPIRAEITGHGEGAIRRCVFSTAPFVEPIEI